MVFSQVDNEPRNQRMDEHMDELAKDYSEYSLTCTHSSKKSSIGRDQDIRYPEIYINGAYAQAPQKISRSCAMKGSWRQIYNDLQV